MNRPSKQLFTCARFSLQQHRSITLGDFLHQRAQLDHLLAFPDDIGDTMVSQQLLAKQRVLFDHSSILKRPVNKHTEMLGIKRLGDKIVRPEFHRLHGIFDCAVGGHHDDRRLVVHLFGA